MMNPSTTPSEFTFSGIKHKLFFKLHWNFCNNLSIQIKNDEFEIHNNFVNIEITSLSE